MHRLRSYILDGRSPDCGPVAEPDRRARSGGPHEAERRAGDRRAAQRFSGDGDPAFLIVRGKRVLVRVINVSADGLTVEAALAPTPGERLRIEGAAASGEVIVRWAEGGRIGLERASG